MMAFALGYVLGRRGDSEIGPLGMIIVVLLALFLTWFIIWGATKIDQIYF